MSDQVHDQATNGAPTTDAGALFDLCDCGHQRCYHTSAGRCVRHFGTCACTRFVLALPAIVLGYPIDDNTEGAGVLVLDVPPAHLTAEGDYACAHLGCTHGLRQHDALGVRCRECADHHQFSRILPPPCPRRFCTEAEAEAALGPRRVLLLENEQRQAPEAGSWL